MVSKPERRLLKDRLNEGALKRRDLIKLGLAGIVFSSLNSGCENKNTTNTPDQPETVYELTDGRTLYDDFDGNGNLQTYNNQNLAEAGKLSSRIWDAPSPGSEVVQSPAAQGPLTVVNEEGQRVEYGPQEEQSPEIKSVYDAEGKLLQAVPHTSGQPYHGSKRLFWVGVRNGRYDTENGSLFVEKGKIYGNAELKPVGGRGWVLKLTSSLPGSLYCFLTSRRGVEFVDYKTLSADVLLPSTSTGPGYFASLCYHTTIPEQPPGLSWVSDLGIRKMVSGEVILFALCVNRNTGYQNSLILGQGRLDTWYNLRMDVVTRRDDPMLKDNEFRLEYYINGELMGSEVPEDSGLLLNPERTGAGPHRFLRLCVTTPEGESFALYDNVRAVYLNRIR
jgi:hypothetical protein